MLKVKILSLALGLCLLSACSPHDVDLAYYCEPSGAIILQEDMGRTGMCPMTLKYNSYDAKIWDGKLHIEKVNVVWPSGASLLQPPMALDIPPDRKINVTFTRPANIPYYKKDQESSAAFDASPQAREIRYVASRYQERDLFASINRFATCTFSGLFWSVDAQCP